MVYISTGIETAVRLDHLTKDSKYQEDAFEAIEKSKSILLTGALKAKRALRFGDLPDSLIAKEEQLTKELAVLESQMLTVKEAEKITLRRELNEVNNSITEFKKILESNYPKYFATKYEAITANAKDVQGLIDEETAFLEYYATDSMLYLFCITKDKIALKTLHLTQDKLNAQINSFRQVLSDYKYIFKNPKETWTLYHQLGYWFFNEIVEPAIADLAGIKHLIIVSDGALGHLPFESFLTKEAAQNKPTEDQDYSSLDYLVKDFKISYNYSATLLKENLNHKLNSNNSSILAYAGAYGDQATNSFRSKEMKRVRNKLKALPAAEEEVKDLEKLLSGRFLYQKAANEADFKQHAADFNVLHLAMHGLLDKKYPILSSLAFSETQDSLEDNFLHAYEISNMKLNANLVVLSACETGYGQFEKGEGVLSLARSFMYAGVPSLVVSLWPVNDGSTSIIMSDFYMNLSKGMDKAESLRQAKLTYLSRQQGLTAHPAFWSPFIQLGDSRAINLDTKGSMNWPLVLGGVVLLGLGIWAGRRKFYS